MKITFEVNTTRTEDELNEDMKVIAETTGWQEQIEEIDDKGETILIDNPITPKEIVKNMLSDFLKVKLKEAYIQKARLQAEQLTIEQIDTNLKDYTSELEITE